MTTAPDPPTPADTAARALAELAVKVPVFGGAVKVIVEDTWARRRARAEAAVQDIADRAGGPDQLAVSLAEDPVLDALFYEAVDGAARTGMESKRRLFARVVGSAVLDDAKVDEAILIVRALRELDVPDIRYLETIRRAYDDVLAVAPGSSDAGDASGAGVSIDQKRKDAVHEVAGDMPAPVRAALISTGTMDVFRGVFGGTDLIGGPSDFGRKLLQDLAEDPTLKT